MTSLPGRPGIGGNKSSQDVSDRSPQNRTTNDDAVTRHNEYSLIPKYFNCVSSIANYIDFLNGQTSAPFWIRE